MVEKQLNKCIRFLTGWGLDIKYFYFKAFNNYIFTAIKYIDGKFCARIFTYMCAHINILFKNCSNYFVSICFYLYHFEVRVDHWTRLQAQDISISWLFIDQLVSNVMTI